MRFFFIFLFLSCSAIAGWVRLPYNTIVPDHIDTNSSVVVSNIYPSEMYLVELAQGIQERCYATATANGSNYFTLSTNWINIYTNTDTRPYNWYTNLPLTNALGVVTGYTIFTNQYVLQETNGTEVVTNYLAGGWGLDVSAMIWNIERTTYDDSVRYITSINTNIYTNVSAGVTNYTTNISVSASMGDNNRTHTNGIDNYVNRDLWQKITDKWYDLVPYYLDSQMTNDTGNYDGLTNTAFPVFTTRYNGTNLYYFADGLKRGRSIWESFPGVYENTNNYPTPTYYTNKYMSGTNVITEIVTNPVNLVDYEHGVIQFPIYGDTGGVVVVTNAWRYGDETNDGAYVAGAWTNWTGNTYAGRYTSYSNWLARHELIKELRWIERDATLQWIRVTNATSDLTVSPNDILDYVYWMNTNGSVDTVWGRDADGSGSDADLATAESEAETDWYADPFTEENVNGFISSYGVHVGSYSVSLNSQNAFFNATNELGVTVAVRIWSKNRLWRLQPTYTTEEDDNGTGFSNAYPQYNQISALQLAGNSYFRSGSEYGAGITIPPWPTGDSADGTNYQRGFYFYLDNEVQAVTEDCDWLFMWQPDEAANAYTYYGNSTYSWGEATNYAEINLLKGEYLTNSATIKWGTVGRYQTNGTYETWIYQQCFEGVVNGLDTNKSKVIDWYAFVQPLNTVVAEAYRSNSYYQVESGERIYYPTSFWVLVDSSNYAANVYSATSPPLGAVSRVANPSASPTNLPAWVENPTNYIGTNTETYVARGWEGSAIKAVVKYDFFYCTNTIP